MKISRPVASGIVIVRVAAESAGTVTVAEPDFDPSATLVAVTVNVCAELVAAGAVNRPLLDTEPPFADQLTDCDGEFVPLTVAENWRVALPFTVAVDGETLTPVTVDPVDAAIVTVAVPDFVESTMLVAVTVIVCTDPVAAGAVKTPPLVMEPAVALQVTACDGEFVPDTVAVKVVDPVAVLGETDTPVTVAGFEPSPAGASGFPEMLLMVKACVPVTIAVPPEFVKVMVGV